MSARKAVNFRQVGRKIVGAARTYKEHAVELNNPIPSEPLIFLKPTSSYIEQGQSIIIPKDTLELHHEVELGVVIDKPGKNIPEASAAGHIGGYVLALDMTNRTEQSKAKKAGHSWCIAKGFDTACPVSRFIYKDEIKDFQNVSLKLKVNGILKQDGNTKDMIFSIPFLISWISCRMSLEHGDLILTGTPPGVGPVSAGDTIECSLNDLICMSFDVKSENMV
ncbi:hypothetical protein HELRODRAFT_186863 [Helobdella robusta]|uniref:Oxaloacetate tautomerase FAHD1, mitochondrial n=1 Tax=Helobdella robusta TaxID=6412 RepID=T1FP43_HELRO|nr:hypothetical protein HELRODRAFT_186863 [Helobdella robusta]ESO07582.1 hypothetical protein HELRODRAFT_186863 [Helobdella robusta]